MFSFPNFSKKLHGLIEDEFVHDTTNIIFPFRLHVMMRFMKYFKHIENYHVKYLTKEDITARNLPLFVSSNSTFCKELQVSLGVYKSHKQVSLTFTDLKDD